MSYFGLYLPAAKGGRQKGEKQAQRAKYTQAIIATTNKGRSIKVTLF